jgi:RecA-family ATPase
MGLFVDGIDTLRHATGAAVLVIHHTGKDKKSKERGSSALRGSADTMISCDGEMGVLTIECDKQKDAEEFKPFTLALRKVELENGRSSCVLVPWGEAAATPSGTDAKDEEILGVLEKDFGTGGATATNWQKACEEKIKVPRKTFYNRLTKLKTLGRVVKEGDQGAPYRVAKPEPVPVSE